MLSALSPSSVVAFNGRCDSLDVKAARDGFNPFTLQIYERVVQSTGHVVIGEVEDWCQRASVGLRVCEYNGESTNIPIVECSFVGEELHVGVTGVPISLGGSQPALVDVPLASIVTSVVVKRQSVRTMPPASAHSGGNYSGNTQLLADHRPTCRCATSVPDARVQGTDGQENAHYCGGENESGKDNL